MTRKIASIVSLIVSAATLTAAAPAGAHSSLRAELVKDLDTTPNYTGQSRPQHFRRIGDAVYFTATTPETGTEVFLTDGTPDGWRVAADIAAGSASSNATAIGEAGGRAIVVASTPADGNHVWALDAAGPTRLTSVPVSVALPAPAAGSLVRFDDRMLFTLGGGSLWATDGTGTGTRNLLAAPGFPLLSYGDEACALPHAALVAGRARDGRYWIVRTDGAAAGAEKLLEIGPFAMPEIYSAALEGRCYFLYSHAGEGWRLWASDGTPAGSGDVATGTDTRLAGIATIGRSVFVAVFQPTFRLLRAEPGAVGAQTVLDVAASTSFSTLMSVGDRLVMLAPTRAGTNVPLGVLVSDGTAAGTAVAYPATPQDPSVSGFPVRVGPAVHVDVFGGSRRVDVATHGVATGTESFSFDDSAELGAVRIGTTSGQGEFELLRSDGSEPGTTLLSDLWRSNRDGIDLVDAPVIVDERIVVFGNRLGRHGLWRTDGTEGGTRGLANDAYAGSVAAIAAHGDEIVFQTRDIDPDAQTRLYRTGADLAAPTLLASAADAWPMLQTAGASVLHHCAPAQPSTSLCSIGMAGGVPVTVTAGTTSEPFVAIGRVGDIAIFAQNYSAQIWRSDGTAPGTFALTAPGVSFPPYWWGGASIEFGGRLFFSTCRNGSQCMLMATDGSVAGTTALRDLPGTMAAGFVRVGERFVFFPGTYPSMQLWASDGTAQGTDLLHAQASPDGVRIVGLGDVAHIALVCPGCKYKYLITDGTPAGTRYVALPPQLVPTHGFLAAFDDDTVLFSCGVPDTGRELCSIDRNGDGARLATDIFPGPGDARPAFLAHTPDGLYLTADDGRHGSELWRLVRWTDAIFTNGFERRGD